MASQYAGWAISMGFSRWAPAASGAGARRARAVREARLRGGGPRGVLVLEGRTLPTDEVAAWVAQRRLAPSQLTFVIAPTASLAGGRANRRADDRDRPPQDGHARVRRPPHGERHRHRAARPDSEERHARHRPHQRLHPVRQPGTLHRPRGDDELAELAQRIPAWPRATTARRSTRSSSATTTTSTRSTPALQPGRGLAHEHETADVSRRPPEPGRAHRVVLPELTVPPPRPRSKRCDGSRAGWSLLWPSPPRAASRRTRPHSRGGLHGGRCRRRGPRASARRPTRRSSP